MNSIQRAQTYKNRLRNAQQDYFDIVGDDSEFEAQVLAALNQRAEEDGG